MLALQDISYSFPNKEILFDNISFSVNHYDKIALIGNNGTGKSTLLKIIANELKPTGGRVKNDTDPYYIPQLFGQCNHLTLAQALQVDDKLNALHAILHGHATEEHLNSLNDDWTIEDRCFEALSHWHLNDLDLTQKMETLSGGQKAKLFLAGITVHQPQLILLDEPSNHLDNSGRQLLYNLIQSTKSALLVVSHDRKLLNLLNVVYELSNHGVTTYGGNYEFYSSQKQIEENALAQGIQSKEKELKKAKETERLTLERQQKLDARGKKKQEKAGLPRIMMNTLRNAAEISTSKIKGIHSEKIGGISADLQELRATLPGIDKMKLGFDHSDLHKGKVLFKATNINFSYEATPLWKDNLSFLIMAGERIALKGLNGSGKTTLIKLIIKKQEPQTGSIYRAKSNYVYIDQDYSLIDNKLTVYEQACQYNSLMFQEHEIKIRLNRFLFTKEDWDKPCSVLSGGERMRLILCCLTISSKSPDLIILDEPTNNLDIQNIQILATAINDYKGTLIVVSHDENFLTEINLDRELTI